MYVHNNCIVPNYDLNCNNIVVKASYCKEGQIIKNNTVKYCFKLIIVFILFLLLLQICQIDLLHFFLHRCEPNIYYITTVQRSTIKHTEFDFL